MNAIILAGGKSSRMGFDKAFLEINGKPLIKRQLELLKVLFKKIIVVTNSPQKYNKLRNIRIITDIIPECGPLGGIYSGLLASDSFYNFIVACDMPFLNKALIKYMISNKFGYDIVIPKVDGKFHPLFGVYSKNCIPIIEEILKQDKLKLKVSTIFPKLKTRFISKQEVQKFDQNMFSLVNINTKKDLMRVKEIEER